MLRLSFLLQWIQELHRQPLCSFFIVFKKTIKSAASGGAYKSLGQEAFGFYGAPACFTSDYSYLKGEMKMKKLLSLLCILAMIFALSACGGSQPAATETPEDPAAEAPAGAQTFSIGICQLVQHPALDAATEGFKTALTEKLGDSVTFNEQNASGDPATCSVICNQFVSDEVDLILANATASLQAASSATNSIPLLGTSITDYGTALGIEGFTGVSGTNISGTSDLAPLDGQAQLLAELFPEAKTVGILYCSGEPN